MSRVHNKPADVLTNINNSRKALKAITLCTATGLVSRLVHLSYKTTKHQNIQSECIDTEKLGKFTNRVYFE